MAPCWGLASGKDAAAVLAFGPLGGDDAEAIVAGVRACLAAGVSAVVLDLTASGPDGLRFVAARELLAGLDALALGARPGVRLALAHPGGMSGALVIGHATGSGRAGLRAATDRASALAVGPLGLVQESLLARLEAASIELGWRARLRRALAAQPRLSASALALEIGWSARTLQRQLEGAGTSFRAERQRMRMQLALELIVAGCDKIAAVAHATGFASESRFVTDFRAHFGVPPLAYRLRALGAGRGVGL